MYTIVNGRRPSKTFNADAQMLLRPFKPRLQVVLMVDQSVDCGVGPGQLRSETMSPFVQRNSSDDKGRFFSAEDLSKLVRRKKKPYRFG